MVLREVLVAIRVHDRLARLAPRERLRAVLAVHVVVRPAVRREVRGLNPTFPSAPDRRTAKNQRSKKRELKLGRTSWMSVPACESVPVVGASQNAPHRYTVPGSPGSTIAYVPGSVHVLQSYAKPV